MKYASAALLGLFLASAFTPANASNGKGIPGNADHRFAQLETLLPTAGTTRTQYCAPVP
jgi:hypothetical protein